MQQDHQPDSLPESLIQSVSSPGIEELSIEAGESLLDAGLDLANNDALKSVPIISHIVNGVKGVISIKDKLYVRKVLKFLFETAKITPKEREKFERKLADNPKERQRLGTTLIEILDSISTSEKAPMLAKVFRAYVAEDMKIDEFVRLCEMIDKSYLSDLLGLQNQERYDSQGLVNSGIKNALDMKNIYEQINRALGQSIAMGGMSSVAPSFDAGFTKDGANLRRILKTYK